MNSDTFVNDGGPVEVKLDEPIYVRVCEFDMTFWRLVTFLVKVAFAALPALIILILAQLFFATLVAAVLMR